MEKAWHVNTRLCLIIIVVPVLLFPLVPLFRSLLGCFFESQPLLPALFTFNITPF